MARVSEYRAASAVQGQVLRLSERREVAIYLRNDRLWVADFIDGRGELIDAITWFRFNCGTHAQARRRMVLESGIPLSAQIVARIEHLHGSPEVRKRSAGRFRAVLDTSRRRLAALFLKPLGRCRMEQADP